MCVVIEMTYELQVKVIILYKKHFNILIVIMLNIKNYE